MALDDLVQVNITTQATAPTALGFGTPLAMAFHTVFAERARVYTSTAAMLTDGFVATDAAFRMVTAILAQNPKVTQVIVGRMANAMTQTILVTPVAPVQDNTDYTVTINGVAFTIDSGVAATAASIATALHTAINLGGEPVTSADNTGSLTLTADVAGTLFTYEVDRTLLDTSDDTPDAGVVADYNAIQNENDDFYSVHLASQGSLEVIALAAVIETQVKLMVVTSQDTDIPKVGGGDLASTLQTSNLIRTALLFHTKAHQYGGPAWAGVMLPKDPGSATWKYKTLAGVDTVVLTATEETNLAGKNANRYVSLSGVSITCDGVAASGRFLDITRGIDWLRARLQERVFAKLAALDKIPFTDDGIGIVEAEVRGQLQDGIAVGLLAADPAPAVTAPLAADVAFVDKAARLLPDVDFTATLAGAIHTVVINGTVSV